MVTGGISINWQIDRAERLISFLVFELRSSDHIFIFGIAISKPLFISASFALLLKIIICYRTSKKCGLASRWLTLLFL